MDRKIAHLEMIQSVVNRMALNSFHLKGWSVTLVAALFALAAKDASLEFVYLAYFPGLCFWLLDGFYLRQERLFRKLYDSVRVKGESEIDYSMDTRVVAASVTGWFCVCVSKTLVVFHGAVVGSTILVMILMVWKNGGN